jgi:hypothetical protein
LELWTALNAVAAPTYARRKDHWFSLPGWRKLPSRSMDKIAAVSPEIPGIPGATLSQITVNDIV